MHSRPCRLTAMHAGDAAPWTLRDNDVQKLDVWMFDAKRFGSAVFTLVRTLHRDVGAVHYAITAAWGIG